MSFMFNVLCFKYVKSKTCTLITGEYMNPTIFTKVPLSVVESWDDADSHNYNKTFDF